MIDVNFDFRSDSSGPDPDTSSPTLRSYHKQLWSKRLSGGVVFELDDTVADAYLYHRSSLGEFFLSSDTVIPTFSEGGRLWTSAYTVPSAEVLAFERLGYTVGGVMLFPGNKVEGHMTINGARGFHPKIRDRFDLTVECIRRYYRQEPSPLAEPLQRYADFFRLFRDFRGYIDFFLLQDLVSPDYSWVDFFLPCQDFSVSPVPDSPDAYRAYRQRAELFLRARNSRIRETTVAAPSERQP